MIQTEETFRLSTNLKPAGDQPKAIEELLDNLLRGVKDQVLLGATGTGKTFTIANVIAKYGKPTLIIAHNKILAAQLYRELKELFPHNRVEYFISYYDYYQPEAYIPEKDLYIEKDASINEILERYRHSATIAVLERRGFSKETINILKKAYRILFRSGLLRKEAIEKVLSEFPDSPEVKKLVEFLQSSKRGVARDASRG